MKNKFNIIDFIKYHIAKFGDLTIFNSDIEQYYWERLHKSMYCYDYQLEKVVRQIYDIADNYKKYEKYFNDAKYRF